MVNMKGKTAMAYKYARIYWMNLTTSSTMAYAEAIYITQLQKSINLAQ
jgi:hypothetical protein